MKFEIPNMLALSLVVGLSASVEGAAPASNLRGPTTITHQHARSLVVDNTRGIDYPFFRFVPWCMLDEKAQDQATELGWSEDTWNVPGTSEHEEDYTYVEIIERSLEENTTAGDAIVNMGWTESVYDCYVNHYEGYNWAELEEEDLLQYWEVLGWTVESWDGTALYPESEFASWQELNETEQAAAVALCYFEELWSELNITEWEEYVDGVDCSSEAVSTIAPTMDQTAAESAAGTAAATAAETVAATAAETIAETSVETVAETSTGTLSATQITSQAPTETQSMTSTENQSPSPTENADVSPSPMATTTTATTEEEVEVEYVSNPMNRYLLWSWLYDVSKIAAMELGYDEVTWNQPMSAEVETMVFEDFDTNMVEAAYVLGLAPAEVWDCHINHYRGYDWVQLYDAGVRPHYEALGWTFSKWNALQSPPATEGMPFASLTEEQQEAARELCYRKETWDQLNLVDWVL